jgi:hypothetical protein
MVVVAVSLRGPALPVAFIRRTTDAAANKPGGGCFAHGGIE